MVNENLHTKEGHERLVAELDELKGPKRMAIADAIREAKSHGDLRENAAYHEAKLNQTRLDQRIAELEGIVMRAKIFDPAEADPNKITLGDRVVLFDEEFDEEFTITLVGSYEADPAKNLISIASPLGKSLHGKEQGIHVEFDAPSGVQRFKIIKFTR